MTDREEPVINDLKQKIKHEEYWHRHVAVFLVYKW